MLLLKLFRPLSKMMKKIVIAGGTGFLGSSLARFLTERNFSVVVLGRHRPQNMGNWNFSQWDAHSLGTWAKELDGAYGVVNLTGRSVDCIKTPENCDDILRSRVESTRALGLAHSQCRTKPQVWVQMSTAHIYGDPVSRVCTEESALGYGLAPTVGMAWENEFNKVADPKLRKVILRTSFVLGKSGGALKRLEKLARLGLGGRVGQGNQGISWIHEEDMNRVFLEALEKEAMGGVYIATAPRPVSNSVFMSALRKAVRIKVGLPARSWMVRIGAYLLLRTDPDLALSGRYCEPKKLLKEGFRFKYSELGEAFKNIFSFPESHGRSTNLRPRGI